MDTNHIGYISTSDGSEINISDTYTTSGAGIPIYIDPTDPGALTANPPIGVTGGVGSTSGQSLSVAGNTNAVWIDNSNLTYNGYLENSYRPQFDDPESYKNALASAKESFQAMVDLIESIEEELSKLDENKARMLMKASKRGETNENDRIWHVMDLGPKLTHILNCNFVYSKDDVEDYIIRYAKAKLEEFKKED